MVTLGVILLIIGLLVNTGLPLTTIGIILIVVGLILNLVPIGGTASASGRPHQHAPHLGRGLRAPSVLSGLLFRRRRVSRRGPP